MSWWGWTASEQLELLQRVGDQTLQRSRLFGDLDPYQLGGQSVSGRLSLLALRGWVTFDLLGDVHVTGRGERALLRAALDDPGFPWEAGMTSDGSRAQPT